MAKVRITQDKELCIGCGACASICPDNWEMGDDNKAHPKQTELDDVGCNKQAEESCPVNCIHVEIIEE